MVNRMPDEARFSTLTEAPNNERIRLAKGGLSPRSPAGVISSPMEKSSKKFVNAEAGIALPVLSITTLRQSGTPSQNSWTVSPLSENFTAVSNSAWNPLINRYSSPRTKSRCTAAGMSTTPQDLAKATVLVMETLSTALKETADNLDSSPFTSI